MGRTLQSIRASSTLGCFDFQRRDDGWVHQVSAGPLCRDLAARRLQREAAILPAFRDSALPQFDGWREGDHEVRWRHGGFWPVLWHPALPDRDQAELLTVLASMVDTVAGLHQNGLLHGALFPFGIWTDSELRDWKFADTSLAVQIPSRDDALDAPNRLTGTEDVERLAPEQRDSQSPPPTFAVDCYGLGRVFEALTPIFDPSLPVTVRDTIAAMQSVDPHQRLHAFFAVQEALRKAQQNGWAVPTAAAGRSGPLHPEPGPLNIAMAGRDEILDDLLGHLGSDPSGTVLMVGPAGIGKTTVARLFIESLQVQKHVVLQARAEPARQEHVLSLWRRLARDFAGKLALSGPEKSDRLRDSLRMTFGQDLSHLCAAIPELSSILGEAEEPRASQFSSELQIHRMLSAVLIEAARQLGNVAIVIDDLQWCDPASLAALRELLQMRGNAPIFIFGLSRYLTEMLDDAVGVSAYRVDLGPVNRDDIATILGRTFAEQIDRANDLVTQIHLISGGNPLHVSQILHAMTSERALRLDPDANCWTWDHSRLSSRTLGESARDLLSRRIANAPRSVREVLQGATLLEDHFDAQTLARVVDADLPQTRQALEQAISLGLIARTDSTELSRFRFVHDQIRLSARQDVEQDAFVALRHAAGLRLLKGKLDPGREQLIVDLTSDIELHQLEPADRTALGEVVLQSAEIARRLLEFDRAEDLFLRAEYLLGRGGGGDDDRLVRLTVERAYCAHARKRPDEVKRHLADALSTLADPVRASTLWRLSCVLDAQNENYIESFHHAVRGLRDLGVYMPSTRSGAIAGATTELIHLALRLGRNPAERIARLTTATDRQYIARIELIRTALPSAYFVAPELMLLGGLKILRLSLTYGRAPGTAVGAALFGLFVSAFLGRRKLGWQIGEAACRAAADYADPEIENEVLLIHGHFVQCWAEDIRNGRALFERGYALARHTGDTQYANFHILAKIANYAATGVHLSAQRDMIERGLSLIRRSNDQFSLRTATAWQAVADYLALPGTTDRPTILNRPVETGSARAVSECYRLIKLCQLEFFAGRHRSALTAGTAADRLVRLIPGQVPRVEHVLYFGLALARAAVVPGGWAGLGARHRLARLMRRLRRWAVDAPETFQDILCIVEAEATALSDGVAVLAALQACSRDFERQDKPFFAALASECSAWHQSQLGIAGAETAAGRAASLYREWGAEAQARRLEAVIAEWTENTAEPSAASPPEAGAQLLDRVVLQAIGELQSRTSPDDLVSGLLETAKAVTGAEFVAYVTRHTNALYVDMELHKSRTPHLVGSNVNCLGPLASAIARFCSATGQEIVGDAQNHPRFSKFRGEDGSTPAWLACLPLKRRNDVFGVIYTELPTGDDRANLAAIERFRIVLGSLAAMFDRLDMQSKLRQYSQTLATNNSKLALLEAAKRRFAPFVPEIIRQTIEADPNRSDDLARPVDVTALILDMEDFTGVSSRISPSSLAKMVQEQFSLLLEPIYDNAGEVCNSMGDGLLVLYQSGTPEEHARAAVSSALQMREIVQLYRRKRNAPALNIGINSGVAMVGLHRFEHNEHRRWFFSATGQVINIAARFADHAKRGQIIIGEETFRRAAGRFDTRTEGKYQFKGLHHSLNIYSVW